MPKEKLDLHVPESFRTFSACCTLRTKISHGDVGWWECGHEAWAEQRVQPHCTEDRCPRILRRRKPKEKK